MLLDPPFEPAPHYTDAIEVAYAVYGTMQRKILEVEMRNTYFQSLGKRALQRIPANTIDAVVARDSGVGPLFARRAGDRSSVHPS